MVKFEKIFFRAQAHYQKKHRIRMKLYCAVIRIVYQCDIPLATTIDKSVYFNHNAFGCVINPNTVIKENVNIQHGVTIGVRNGVEAPIIEKDVVIGAKAIIIGNIRVGEGSKIGAGAVVIHDVTDGCIVVGNPARIICQE